MKKYKIIYADPAWVYENKLEYHGGGAESHYICTPTEEMGEIPIPAEKDSICLMWCTYPKLPEGLKLMALWGFEYRTVAFTWVKKYRGKNKFFFGMGKYTRANPEVCLLGRRGKGVPRVSASVPNLQIHTIGAHSAKPEAIKLEIIKLFGDVSRIELFSRTKQEAWDVWGNEAPKEEQKILKEDS